MFLVFKRRNNATQSMSMMMMMMMMTIPGNNGQVHKTYEKQNRIDQNRKKADDQLE